MITTQTLLYALTAIVAFSLILLLLFTYLFIKRLQQNKFENNVNDYITNHLDDWYDYLIDDDASSIINTKRVRTKAENTAVDKIFSHYIRNVKDDTVHNKIAEYVNMHSRNFYLKKIQSKNWGERISTLYKMSDYQMSFLLPKIEEMLQNSKSLDIEEYVIILKVLSIYNRDLFLAHLVKPKLNLGEFEYIKLIHQLDESYVDILLEQFEDLPDNLRVAFIVVMGYQAKSDIKYIMFLEELLSYTNSEIRIRALKSLTQIGAFSEFEKYKQFVQSEVWEERLMLAKLLVNVKESIARPYLEKLIEDDTWWVRKQAAMTLSNIRNGAQSLEHIIKFSNDRYAVDMAKEILGEG